MPNYRTTQIKFKIDAIIPKRVPVAHLEDILDSYEKYFKGDLARTLKSDFNETVDEWHNPPTFETVFARPYGNMALTVRPYGYGKLAKQWRWISGGLPKKDLVSKKGVMVFKRDYIPATDPHGSRPNRPRLKYGEWRRTRVAHNHGIEARQFCKRIKEKREKEIIAHLYLLRDRVLLGRI